MAAPQINMRWPRALIARVDAQCARRDMTRTDYAIEAVLSLLELDESTPDPPKGERPLPEQISTAHAPKATRAAAALATAEARQGVTKAHLDTSAVPVFAGGKRPAYQKTGGPKAAGRGGRR